MHGRGGDQRASGLLRWRCQLQLSASKVVEEERDKEEGKEGLGRGGEGVEDDVKKEASQQGGAKNKQSPHVPPPGMDLAWSCGRVGWVLLLDADAL